MAIIQTLSFDGFERAFINYGRNNQFSHEGLWSLFCYLEEYSEAIGEHIELDVIDLCCDYIELSLDEIKTQYDIDCDDIDTALDLLSEKTFIIGYHYDENKDQYYILFKAY